MKVLSALALVCLGVGIPLGFSAENDVQFKIQPGMRADNPTAIEEFEKQRELLSRGTLDPTAQPLVAMAESLVRKLFNLHNVQAVRFATRAESVGDTLYGEWTAEISEWNVVVLMRNGPLGTNFLVRFDTFPPPLQFSLERLLKQILAWGKSPIYLRSLTVTLPADNGTITHFRAEAQPMSSIASVADFRISAEYVSPHLVLSFFVGEHFVADPPINPAFVPERFPPLKDLVTTWSRERLVREIGATASRPFPGNLTEERDRIITSELVRRGLSDEDLVRLLTDVPNRLYQQRATGIILGIRAAGQQVRYLRAFAETIGQYERIGVIGDSAAEVLFYELANHCAEQFENLALEALTKQHAVRGALGYLQRCGKTQRTYDLVESTQVSTDFSTMRMLTLGDIKSRIRPVPSRER
jgi:hypothetical protein